MRARPIGLLLSGVVVASSACSMDATSPSPLAAPAPAARATGNYGGEWSNWAGRPARDDHFPSAGAAVYVVTVDPQRGNVLHFGGHTLEIPANAICNQDAGYGLESFDLDCKAEKDPVTITALVRASAGGIPRIDLMPQVRFSPKRTVTLSLRVPDLASIGPSPTILYCATTSTELCVDESALDPTLTTHVDAGASTVFRRIKHFSGYFVQE
jgi:hypothetical protein